MAAGLQFHYKRKTPKTILASSRFPGAAPAAAGFEDIRTGAQFAAQSVQEKVYFLTPTSGSLPAEETRSAQTVMRMES